MSLSSYAHLQLARVQLLVLWNVSQKCCSWDRKTLGGGGVNPICKSLHQEYRNIFVYKIGTILYASTMEVRVCIILGGQLFGSGYFGLDITLESEKFLAVWSSVKKIQLQYFSLSDIMASAIKALLKNFLPGMECLSLALHHAMRKPQSK